MPPHLLRLSPAAERNKEPILAVLRQLLPEHCRVLEIASGTGQHAASFAAAMPNWQWQPTDLQAQALADIQAWVAETGATNVLAPLRLDVQTSPWPLDATPGFDAIYCANLLHIAPWDCCRALMEGAARHLAPQGLLITYGPYLEDRTPTSAGNLAFDESLRRENAAWGIRRREDVQQEAWRAGLVLRERHTMPANNLLLVWAREP